MNKFEHFRSQFKMVWRLRDGITIIALLFFVLPTLAIAKSSDTAPPMPLEKQEQFEQYNKALSAMDNLNAIVDELSTIKKDQCMKAFGNTDFCNCIVEKSPVDVNFIGYVSIITSTKEDLKYATLSPDDKKRVDTVRKARDECISWKSK